jgi:hypothetical protein
VSLPTAGRQSGRSKTHDTATLKSIRAKIDIPLCRRRKGLQMTITVKAYDNGLVEVDGRPINQAMPPDSYDQGHRWLGAAEHIRLAVYVSFEASYR